MQKDFKFNTRYIAISIMLMAFLLTISGCKSKQGAEPSTPITMTKAITDKYVMTETATGTLSSLHTVTVSAETSGRVLNMLVDVGQKVKMGETLLEINPTEQKQGVDQQSNNLKTLQALLLYQEKQVQRYQYLVSKNVTPIATYDQEKAKLASLKSQISAMQARLANSQYQLNKTLVISPLNGFVTKRHVLVGDFVTTSLPLIELVDTTQLRAKLTFPETLRDSLKIGLPVTLSSIASPNETLSTKITAINPVIDENSRSIEVIVDFDNASHWTPGASINGEVTLQVEPDVVMVPNSSVVQRPRGFVVYVIDDHLVAHEQLVEVGPQQKGKTVIRKGLTADTLVAVDGAPYLSDGVTVRNIQK